MKAVKDEEIRGPELHNTVASPGRQKCNTSHARFITRTYLLVPLFRKSHFGPWPDVLSFLQAAPLPTHGQTKENCMRWYL